MPKKTSSARSRPAATKKSATVKSKAGKTSAAAKKAPKKKVPGSKKVTSQKAAAKKSSTKKNAAVDKYIASAPEFAQPILKRVRTAFHQGCPSATESIKWGIPCFEHHGILGSMAAFKKHVAVGFWRSKEMKDPAQLLARRAASMCNARFETLKDMPAAAVLADYVKQAAELNERAAAVPKKKTQPVKVPPMPPALQSALADSKAAQKVFNRFAPGQRRDYIEWIVEAKREETRQRRVTQAIEWIEQGKTRHWKYEAKR